MFIELAFSPCLLCTSDKSDQPNTDLASIALCKCDHGSTRLHEASNVAVHATWEACVMSSAYFLHGSGHAMHQW